jgi:hypothetical protein
MFDLIPNWAKALITGVSLALLLAAGWQAKSVVNQRDQLLLEVAAQAAQLANATKVQEVTSTVLSSRVQSTAAIKTKAKNVQSEIIKRIPVVPVSCNLTGDWRVLHDESTTNDALPPATTGADAPTVTPVEAAITVTNNYAICLDNSDRLVKLQLWIKGVSTP